jgi:HEAT repeat protein
MISLQAWLALAGLVAIGGLGPMLYALLRRLRERATTRVALLRIAAARAAVSSDLGASARALAGFEPGTIDRTIEALAAEAATPEQAAFVGRLAKGTGAFDRLCERAEHGRSWSERAEAARLLGKLAQPEGLPALTAILRDRYEDEVVRGLAADGMAAIQDPAVLPLLAAELRSVDEQATPRVAEALIRFGALASPVLIALLADKEHMPARVWAARILCATRDVVALEELLASLRDRSDALRAASAQALGALADQRALAPLIQVALRDPAPLVRAEAAQAAAQISGPEAAEVLVAALSDPDYATRLRALEAFESMRLGDTSALEKALGDENAEVQRRAALALERLGFLDRLIEALGSLDPKPRAAAYAGLLQLGRAGLVEGIAARLRHESMAVRSAIAKACGELRAERAGPSLLKALVDPAWPVRAALCEAIGQLKVPGGAPLLLPLLLDPEESVREAAATALAAYGGGEVAAGPAALRGAYEHGSIPIRLAMVAIAAGAPGPELSPLLVDALRDPSEAVRLRAVGALAQRPNPAATAALIASLTDASLEVRMAVVPALGATGSAEAFEALLGTLTGAQPELREHIAEALSGVGRHHLLANLRELAASGALDVRLGIAWTLGKIGDPIGVPVLCAFLRDADPKLRASAAGALGKITSQQTVRALLDAIADPDPKTRAAVVNSLGKCGSGQAEVREALEQRLQDPDAFVRNRAGISLARVAPTHAAPVARAAETAQRIDPAALVIMQGLCATPETVALALAALADPLRLPAIQRFFDREEPAVCGAFLSALKLREAGGGQKLQSRLDPIALAFQYERLLRSSQDATSRRAAVTALGGIRGDVPVLVFAAALGADPDDAVRLQCAGVLARSVDDERARAALLRAVGDPYPPVAVAAVESLRGRREAEVATVLFRRLGSGSAAVNQAVEHALAELYRADLFGFIDRALGTDRPAAIIAAIRVLDRMEQPAAYPLLSQFLKSPDPEVRAAAVRACAKNGPLPLDELVGALRDDPHEAVRIACLEVVASAPDASLRLMAARTDPSVAVRCRLGQLLERLPATVTYPLVEALIDDGSPLVAAAALLSLLGFADLESLLRFRAHWTKAPAEVARAAQLELRAPALTRRLATLLNAGGDYQRRELAVFAIAALANDRYEQLLLPVLHDPRVSVRLAAARALASSNAPEIQTSVRALAHDPERAVREVVRAAQARFAT